MGLVPFSLPADEPVICRECVRCGAVLDVTPEDHLVCPRCGRVSVWTVSVNGQVVAAGREALRNGYAIWLADSLDDLRTASFAEPADCYSGWDEDS